MLQVADPAMHHLERVRRGRPGKVRPLDQCGAQPALGGVKSGGRPEHAAPDHDEIELRPFQCAQVAMHERALSAVPRRLLPASW